METGMRQAKFSIAHQDAELVELVSRTDQRILAVWAIDCAERVLPYFEMERPRDYRPRQAIETLQEWLRTGVFRMAVIRKASLEAHAAAREVGRDDAARSAARAAGQAVATAHVPRHAYGPAVYGQQAVFVPPMQRMPMLLSLPSESGNIDHLLELRRNSSS